MMVKDSGRRILEGRRRSEKNEMMVKEEGEQNIGGK